MIQLTKIFSKLLAHTAFASIFLFLGVIQIKAATISVPADYSSIQSAVNAASSGDTIIVSPGTYNEDITINKAITLRASSYDQNDPRNNTTIIDGNNATAVITIPSNVSGNPTITGFVLRNADSGVVSNSIFTLEYSHLYDGDDLAEYEAGSGGVNRGNVYTNIGDDCIDLDNQMADVLLENNLCIDPPDDGIEMRFQDDNLNQTITVTVRGNRIEDAGGDGFQFIDYSTDTKRRVILEKNLFLNNSKAGIGFLCCTRTSNDLSGHDMREEARIINNTFVSNGNGITGGGNALVLNNIFLNHPGVALKNVTGSSYVSHNLFFGNGTVSSGTNINFSLNENPQLDSSYQLQDTSVAVDAGVSSYVWNSLFGSVNFSIASSEYAGNGPDLGWKETNFSNDPPLVPSPSPTTSNPTPTPTSTSGENSVIAYVAANSDDAEENTIDGSVDLSSTDLEFVVDGSKVQLVGIRFDSLAIPQGATITDAYLKFTADESHTETTNLEIYAENSDAALTFNTTTNNLSSRPKTQASTSWSNVPSWSAGSTYNSPDISGVIQEVVSRGGWSSGNAFAVLISGSGHRTADSFDGSNATATQLVVTYTTGGTNTTPPSCTPVSGSPDLSTSFSVSEAGDYHIWARVRATDSQNDSFYLQIDDDSCLFTMGDTLLDTNSWTWINYADGDVNRKVITNLSAGDHMIHVYARENVEIDSFIVTNDPNCTPEGPAGTCTDQSSNSESNACKSDIDQSGEVNILDFLILSQNYLADPISNQRADINGDGTVNVLDFLVLSTNYKNTCTR